MLIDKIKTCSDNRKTLSHFRSGIQLLFQGHDISGLTVSVTNQTSVILELSNPTPILIHSIQVCKMQNVRCLQYCSQAMALPIDAVESHSMRQRNSHILGILVPSCSKLTMSLVNNWLKFQMAILQINCYFLYKKCENMQCKGFSHFFSKKYQCIALQRILTIFQQKITVYCILQRILTFFHQKITVYLLRSLAFT